jgi:hypothetical protein
LDELAASDVRTVVTTPVPFLRHANQNPCPGLEVEFGLGDHLLRDHQVGWYAPIWSDYQALEALFAASLLPGHRDCRTDLRDNLRALVENYWDKSYSPDPAAFDQGPNAVHLHWDPPRLDDNLWMGLTLMRSYLASHDSSLLGRAAAVFDLAIHNWDPKRGGIYWEERTPGASDYEKAVVSNAPAVILGAALYSQTGARSYLAWCRRILTWLRAHLFDPRTGLYDDHVNDHGGTVRVDASKLTYNEGVVVAALTALSVVDGGDFPLNRATALAARSMAYFNRRHTYGQPAFDAIWADSVLWTAGLSGKVGFLNQARASVREAAKAAPAAPHSLITFAARTTLQELNRLPASSYRRLGYVRSPR